MAQLVEYLAEEQLQLGLVSAQDKRRLTVQDARGRTGKVAPDKVLFRHEGGSVEELEQRLEALSRDVDVELLWESVQDGGDGGDGGGSEAPELALLYFDAGDDAFGSAIFRALTRERLHFRRRGRSFVPRTADEIEQLRRQREAERRVAREQAELERALAARQLEPELCERLERYLRFGDKLLDGVLAKRSRQPERHAFELLQGAGHLGPTEDLEVVQANLRTVFSDQVLDHAAAVQPAPARGAPLEAAFSIDDPDTREVDDALSVTREGELVRVDVDIADVAALVQARDPVDEEALRRATTVYLPTRVIRMLPERIGCDLSSLVEGEARPVIRTSVWLDHGGAVRRFELSRAQARVARRLDYDGADRQLREGTGETAEALQLLRDLADALAARRRADGALSFRQREWKLHVSADGETIEARPIPHDSPSRGLVAEMMILANGLAARFAAEQGLPIIYRVQPPPAETPPELEPDDPAAFAKLRGLLQPATLSLQPAKHWGLGLERYTQASSPLRRYTDLVIQRQLNAALAGQPSPYQAEELLKVLATAESTEREIKRLEAVVTTRWALEYVARLPARTGLEAWIVAEAPAGGYRIALAACGAQGILNAPPGKHAPGALVRVDVKTLKPRQGVLRAVLASGAAD